MANHIPYPETPKFQQAITDAKYYAEPSSDGHEQQLPILNFVGTVKLHGANAAIQYRKGYDHWCQSRNRIITRKNDYEGFAQHMYSHADEFFSTYVCAHCPIIRERYQAGDTIAIYGEWCGGKVQKNVAISGLPTMFVIIKVKIVNELTTVIASADKIHKQPRDPRTYWLDPREWATIKWHQRSIYNIFDFPTYTMEIDFNNPTVVEEPLSQITEQVERECPVGAYFKRIGIGEGVVWTEWTKTGGNLIFKVKGRKHLVTQPKVLVSATITKCANINGFIEYACTENRMFQALDYMREQNVPIEIKSLNVFLKWLTEDIIKEEKDTMNESGINTKEMTRAMKNKAEPFFMGRLKQRRKRNNRLRRAGKK